MALPSRPSPLKGRPHRSPYSLSSRGGQGALYYSLSPMLGGGGGLQEASYSLYTTKGGRGSPHLYEHRHHLSLGRGRSRRYSLSSTLCVWERRLATLAHPLTIQVLGKEIFPTHLIPNIKPPLPPPPSCDTGSSRPTSNSLRSAKEEGGLGGRKPTLYEHRHLLRLESPHRKAGNPPPCMNTRI